MLLLNCSSQNKDCVIQGVAQSHIPDIFYYSQICIPLTGSLLNGLCLYIFFCNSRSMNTKFLIYYRFSLAISFFVTLNYLLFFLAAAFVVGRDPDQRFEKNYFIRSYDFMAYCVYAFIPITSSAYTFGSLLDIVIIYERILLYVPTIKFLRNIKVYFHLIVILVITLIVNLVPNLSRTVSTDCLSFNHTLNISVYLPGKRYFYYNSIFNASLYTSRFLRDILVLAVELLATIILVISIVRFSNAKSRAQSTNEESTSSNKILYLRNINMNISKITLCVCGLSTITHISIFVLLIALADSIVIDLILFIIGYLLLIRHCLNFFILYKLNKKFKRNFITLIPEWLKMRRGPEGGPTDQDHNTIHLNRIYQQPEMLEIDIQNDEARIHNNNFDVETYF